MRQFASDNLSGDETVCPKGYGTHSANAAATCSPITEVLNGTADYMFVAVSAGGNLTASGANRVTGLASIRLT